MEMGWRTFGVPGITDITKDIPGPQTLTHPNLFRDTFQMAAVIAKPVISSKTDPAPPLFIGIIDLLIPFIGIPKIFDHS